MFRKIEHLGIAVNNMEEALKIYEDLLGQNCYKIEVVESEFVKTAFIQVGESKIELLEATHSDSAIAKFLEKKGQGFHHVAFDVENIDSEINRGQTINELLFYTRNRQMDFLLNFAKKNSTLV
jgi:methylmalonyl-CoA/ethylmalonyl-CoA epimerase